MPESHPSKKDFADLLNQLTGRHVHNEKSMDRLLHQAKKSYHHRGPEGLFDYVRQLTQVPLSNNDMKQMMDSIKGAGSPDQAFERLVDQKWLSDKQASALEHALELETKKGTKKKKRRKR
ncbi:hypothetical protein GXN76_12025 [Kroppenstedtia pulmonis]|uniref:Uncharacterized protein n=1 Tax=Kroppenstedtia pulmonis TaxID=1380685 RepID=A0A7D3XRG4_9BACL|nr:hypothetical protein [Kroppenstedtia pulmonis]QKG85122.1 hypothetical protein GXN76_12025 [Kroppenstedtia pulmonis]